MGLRFSCDRAILAEGIGIAARVAMARSSMPVLEGILVSGGTGFLRLTGYNLESGMDCVVDAEVKEMGDIVIPAATFGDIVRKLPDGIVTVETQGTKIEITGGLSEFSIMGYPAEDFPEVSMERIGKSFNIEQGMLKNMVNRSVFAVSSSDAKPVHTGCKFTVEKDDIEVVGVDGYRLALRKEKLKEEALEGLSFVVSGKILTEISRIIGDGEEKVTVFASKRSVLFETENFRLVTRTLEGEFLNYNNAIPTTYTIKATVDTKLMGDCLERAGLLISEKQRSPVRVKFEDNTALFTCASPLGRVSDEIPVKSSGGELEMGFNNKFLQDALRHCGEEFVSLEMATTLAPLVIRPTAGDNFTYLVLPVRLKAQ